jgi:hypothetical protein
MVINMLKKLFVIAMVVATSSVVAYNGDNVYGAGQANASADTSGSTEGSGTFSVTFKGSGSVEGQASGDAAGHSQATGETDNQ